MALGCKMICTYMYLWLRICLPKSSCITEIMLNMILILDIVHNLNLFRTCFGNCICVWNVAVKLGDWIMSKIKDMFIVYHCQNLTALAICLCVYTCNNSRTAEQSIMKLWDFSVLVKIKFNLGTYMDCSIQLLCT